jgi:hypothetical protein
VRVCDASRTDLLTQSTSLTLSAGFAS